MNIQKTITGLFRKGMKSKLGNAIVDLLSKEGFRPELDNGCVVFKIEGTVFYFSLDDKDEYFIRLVLPNFYEVTGENKVLALYNMNYLNFSYKMVKFYMNDDLVSVGIDMLLCQENIERDVFRMLNLVSETAREFCKEMEKEYSCY
jgi:MFS superfamily sulfate permease-like transporter